MTLIPNRWHNLVTSVNSPARKLKTLALTSSEARGYTLRGPVTFSCTVPASVERTGVLFYRQLYTELTGSHSSSWFWNFRWSRVRFALINHAEIDPSDADGFLPRQFHSKAEQFSICQLITDDHREVQYSTNVPCKRKRANVLCFSRIIIILHRSPFPYLYTNKTTRRVVVSRRSYRVAAYQPQSRDISVAPVSHTWTSSRTVERELIS